MSSKENIIENIIETLERSRDLYRKSAAICSNLNVPGGDSYAVDAARVLEAIRIIKDSHNVAPKNPTIDMVEFGDSNCLQTVFTERVGDLSATVAISVPFDRVEKHGPEKALRLIQEIRSLLTREMK